GKRCNNVPRCAAGGRSPGFVAAVSCCAAFGFAFVERLTCLAGALDAGATRSFAPQPEHTRSASMHACARNDSSLLIWVSPCTAPVGARDGPAAGEHVIGCARCRSKAECTAIPSIFEL